VKSTSQRASRENHALPFIKQGEQVTLMRRDKPRERRGGECAWAACVRGELFTHVACPAVPVCCCCCCIWLPVLVHASGSSNECLQHLAHAWEMRTQNYSGGLPTSRKLPGWCCTWCESLDFSPFSLTEINRECPLVFVVVFLHRNKSRKPPQIPRGHRGYDSRS
jgi:hypothetical protein